jgi:hypothetical protein
MKSGRGSSVWRLVGFAVLVPLVAAGCGATRTVGAAPSGTGKSASGQVHRARRVRALTAAPSPASVRATIMFVGDSNIERALTALGIALTDRDEAYELVDVARAGTGIRSFDCPRTDSACPTGDYWKSRLPDALQHAAPDGYVVDLGINDTVAPGTATTPGYADYAQKIDWLMRLLPPSKPVWWTNLPCAIEPTARATGCAAVDAALAAAPQRWPNLTMLDWASVADAHPSYLLSTLKHIHFSQKGALMWSRLIARSLDAHFPE